MKLRMRTHLTAIGVLISIVAPTARAVESGRPPASVVDLYNRIPDPPATSEEAATWFDGNRRLVQPALVTLKADVDAHTRSVARVRDDANRKGAADAVSMGADLGKPLQAVGIDMTRMQSDPAYAKAMKEKMSQMSPQEMVELSKQMAMSMNAGNQKRAQVVRDEPPAVRAASDAGRGFIDGQAARAAAHQALWEESDKSVERIAAKPYALDLKPPALAFDALGCDSACQTAWRAYAQKVLPLMAARDTEILQVRRATFQRERAALLNEIKTAGGHFEATQYGAAAASATSENAILTYDDLVITEMNQMIEKSEAIAHDASRTARCGEGVVLFPRGCR
jgi:hypothetical protein